MSETVRQVTRGAGWIYAYRWVDRLVGFGAIVVLARVLSPEEFGLVAIAASYVAIVEGLSEFDVTSALIRTRDERESLYDTAWSLATIRGVVSAGVVLALIPFVADPRVGAILGVLAASPLLTGLANPRFVLFERELDYSRLAVQTLAARGVSVGLTLAVALVFRSYWALVVGQLAHSATVLVLSYALRPYRPRVSVAHSRDLVAFSGWMSLTTMVTTLAMQTDRIIIGRLLGVADAGSYYMTQRVGVMPTGELVSPLRRILFPSFSAIVGDTPRLRRVVCESIGLVGSLSLPAGVGFALVASDAVPLVLGERWQGIVPLLWILVPFLGVRATLSMTLPCMMALGQTRRLCGVSVIYALVHLPLFIAGTAVFGLTGAVGAIVVAGVFYTALNVWMLMTTLGIGPGEILTLLRRSLGATGLMLGTIVVVDATMVVDLFPVGGSWLAMSVKVGLGALVFCVAHYTLWRVEGRPMGIEQRLRQVMSR